MNTIATQRKPIRISFVERMVRYYPNYTNASMYLKVFLRDNPNQEGMVTIDGDNWTDVSRWMVNNPNHPEVDEVRVLVLRWKPCQEDITVVKDNVVMTLDSLMVKHDRESNEWITHEFRAQYADRYPQQC